MFFLNYVGLRKSAANCVCVAVQARNYAARKGYREKAKKKKVKVEEKKVGFIPHNKRNINRNQPTVSKREDDSWKSEATDDVYVTRFYKVQVYSFLEALQCHRETHHPTVYNLPKSPLNVKVELDMRSEKKNKFVERFSRMVAIPHPYDHGEERKILAFCKSHELQEAALNAGAMAAGGSELIRSIQVGEVSVHDYSYIVAHNDILPELVALRGLMKKNFPNLRNGTLVDDIENCVKRFNEGLFYMANRDEFEEDYGWIDTCLGTLDMEGEMLEGNLKTLLQDINSVRPKREGPFITKCLLLSPPSVERLKVQYSHYLEGKVKDKKSKLKEVAEESSDSDDEVKKSSAASQAG